MDRHLILGKRLGYEWQDLTDFIKKQQDLEREERAAQRDYELTLREAKDKKLNAEQREREMEL